MFGYPKTRVDIQTETGLRGKELTTFLKTAVQGGGMVKRQAHIDPTRSSKRQTVYQTVPTQSSLDLEVK